ncbi:hypothetical protein M6B38_271695 [Iris pallida]|uniref:Uncharacterized protein n=1 Tax=Iris pallida TaxID=29817 RepID=A0AAX6I6U9_IRIPA|nr:hypothetical protein M6B38_271695 [Iris pallida]
MCSRPRHHLDRAMHEHLPKPLGNSTRAFRDFTNPTPVINPSTIGVALPSGHCLANCYTTIVSLQPPLPSPTSIPHRLPRPRAMPLSPSTSRLLPRHTSRIPIRLTLSRSPSRRGPASSRSTPLAADPVAKTSRNSRRHVKYGTEAPSTLSSFLVRCRACETSAVVNPHRAGLSGRVRRAPLPDPQQTCHKPAHPPHYLLVLLRLVSHAPPTAYGEPAPAPAYFFLRA